LTARSTNVNCGIEGAKIGRSAGRMALLPYICRTRRQAVRRAVQTYAPLPAQLTFAGGAPTYGRRAFSIRTTKATATTMIVAPTSVIGVTTSSRIRKPSTIATTGFTYA
jgi:hypothetical protein